VPDVVEHGVTGLLAPSGDATAVAAHVTDLLRAPERRAALGRAGRVRVMATYGADRLVTDIEALYESLLAGQ
jgi:glycosyltransferase involved in cell wall biosynthesis